jgi:ABC-type lipopolysaccharide export system ATPase subunit
MAWSRKHRAQPAKADFASHDVVLRSLTVPPAAVMLAESASRIGAVDHAYVIADGRPLLDGPSREVAANPEIRQAYLGL